MFSAIFPSSMRHRFHLYYAKPYNLSHPLLQAMHPLKYVFQALLTSSPSPKPNASRRISQTRCEAVGQPAKPETRSLPWRKALPHLLKLIMNTEQRQNLSQWAEKSVVKSFKDQGKRKKKKKGGKILHL